MNSKHFEEGTYLLPKLLDEVSDQIPERMHLVRSDSPSPQGHPYRAVCGYNASLSLEWGRYSSYGDNDLPRSFEAGWSKAYADPEVWAQELTILLHGAAIYEMPLALVDGARCWIPFPRPVQDGQGFEVTAWATAVVRLANDLAHATTDTLDYLNRADISVVTIPPLADKLA